VYILTARLCLLVFGGGYNKRSIGVSIGAAGISSGAGLNGGMTLLSLALSLGCDGERDVLMTASRRAGEA